MMKNFIIKKKKWQKITIMYPKTTKRKFDWWIKIVDYKKLFHLLWKFSLKKNLFSAFQFLVLSAIESRTTKMDIVQVFVVTLIDQL